MYNEPPQAPWPETTTTSLLVVPWVRPWSGLSWEGWSRPPPARSLGRWAVGWLGLMATCTGVCAGSLRVPQLTLPTWRLGFHVKPWLHSHMTSFLLRSIGQGTSQAHPDGGKGWMRRPPGRASSPGSGQSRGSELLAALPACHSQLMWAVLGGSL